MKELYRKDNIEDTLSDIINHLEELGYTRQVRSIEGSTNIQEQGDNDIRRTESCGAQIMCKKKSNKESPFRTLQSPDLSTNSIPYSKLQ